MKIGLFGGSFNPPHKGHLRAADIFYTEEKLNKLIIMPTYVSPFKSSLLNNQASCLHRVEMSRLCFQSLCDKGYDVSISTFEAERETSSFTIDTVKHINQTYKDCKLVLYMGSDMLFSFEHWKSFDEILKLCSIFTLPRTSADRLKMTEYCNRYRNLYNAQIVISKELDFEVSSTDIRQSIEKNIVFDSHSLLTDEVLRYIIENKLYTE